MESIKALFTRNTDDWRTPSAIYDTFIKYDFFDVCPFKSESNLYGKLLKNKRVYINPPFSQNKMWIKYAIDLSKYNDVWLLIAVRSDTIYFRELIESTNCKIYFITGRISFNDKGHAPFPVCFIHLGVNKVIKNKFDCFTQNEFITFLNLLYS